MYFEYVFTAIILFSNFLWSTNRKAKSTFPLVCFEGTENTLFEAFSGLSYLFLFEGFDELYIPAQHEIFNSCSSIPVQLSIQKSEFECRKDQVHRHKSTSAYSSLPLPRTQIKRLLQVLFPKLLVLSAWVVQIWIWAWCSEQELGDS